MSLKSKLLAFLPPEERSKARARYRSLKATLGVWAAGRRDAHWYCRNSGIAGVPTKGVLQAKIIKSYHRIEKGLALAEPRPGFGIDAVTQLIDDVATYAKRFGSDHVVIRALQTLVEYDCFNNTAGQGSSKAELAARKAGISLEASQAPEGGTIEVSRSEIHHAAMLDLEPFFRHRYSVRQFDAKPVERKQIERAIAMAQKTPSVCNREAGRVYVVSDRKRAAELLTYQNGNRGFGDQADKLLIVTASLDCFLSVGERHQCWIDGGLFAMSLIYALHSLGLGTCCLNWSVEPATDATFKQASGIPEGQAIIMLIAVGHLPDTFRVAASARRPISEVMIDI
jgi:nitroreductase